MAQPPTRHGFTLIELLLAVALSALLLLVAFEDMSYEQVASVVGVPA